MTLDQEAERATLILNGKSVARVERFRPQEVLIKFEDGTRLFIDSSAALELSITAQHQPRSG